MSLRIIVRIGNHAVLIALLAHVEERIGHPLQTSTGCSLGKGTVWYRETSQRDEGD